LRFCTQAPAAPVTFTVTEVNDVPQGTDDILPDIAEDPGPQTISFNTATASLVYPFSSTLKLGSGGSFTSGQAVRVSGTIDFRSKDPAGPVQMVPLDFEMSAAPPTWTNTANNKPGTANYGDPTAWTFANTDGTPSPALQAIPDEAGARARFVGAANDFILSVDQARTLGTLDIDQPLFSVASQASGPAVLIAALPSPHAAPTRFEDALVGGLIGLAVLAVVPRNQVRTLREAVDGLAAALAEILGDLAGAIERGDAAAATYSLHRANAAPHLGGRFDQLLQEAEEAATIAPVQRANASLVELYAAAAPHVDYALRNTRVLARAARAALEKDGKEVVGGVVTMRYGESAPEIIASPSRKAACRRTS
jgi:hypothetical protein